MLIFKHNIFYFIMEIMFTHFVKIWLEVRVVVFNATLNNISVISWRSVLLVEEIGVPGENHRHATSHGQTLSHNVVSSTPCISGIRNYNVSGDRHWLHRYF
jgi:hypothetical protein